ncbi:helix-turn-helix domain-containing protein [Arthrobacter glacialis]|uniref:helix-turn-helix domain-containing protein n=1 Tax=Arthrobacter glacialis TaxID=1664 RepID=UPI000CD3C5F1|nr:helix-turn-helix domain-containing protein [Arthrobacter glacialis]POH58248.1 hypothetical protein CVS28_12450 [Arthrobacter glacialis]
MTIEKLAYTLEEAAEQSGFTVNNLRAQVNSGRLAARQAGRESAIRHAVLAAWLDTLPTKPVGGHDFGVERATEESIAKRQVQDPVPTKSLVRTPEEVGPELGLT